MKDMMKYVKMIRRGDVMIVLLLMMASFLPLGIFTYNQASADQSTLQAVVESHGEVVKVFDLVDDGQTEIFEFEDEHGHKNTIVRTGTTVEISEANCRDQVCVRMNGIDAFGETILCLPHQVLVEVTGDGPAGNDSEIDVISLR